MLSSSLQKALSFCLTTAFTAVLTLTALSQPANAQFASPFGNQTADEVQNVFAPPPRELRLRISGARKSIEDGLYRDAVLQLGSLLVEPTTEDFFISHVAKEGAQPSLKAEAENILRSMPKEGREEYEREYGPEARRELNAAVETHDIAKLANVSRRYFHTQAGYEAVMLLGRHQLDHGQPASAAYTLQRLVSVEGERDRFEPALSLVLASAWLYSGQADKASETLIDLKKRHPDTRVNAGGQQMRLFETEANAVAWLEKVLNRQQQGGGDAAQQWAMYRGGPARNAKSQGGLPLRSIKWLIPTVNDAGAEKYLDSIEKEMEEKGESKVPALQSLAIGDNIIMRTPDRMIGIGGQTGRRMFEYPWFRPKNQESAGAYNAKNPNLARDLKQRLYEDAIHGQMSSNGKLLFMIDQLQPARPTNRSVNRIVIGPGGVAQRGGNGPDNTNLLVAISLEREGAQIWAVGGDGSQSGDYGQSVQPGYENHFFLGAPLVVQDQLFVLAEVNAEIRLVCIDARTGKMLWKQQIATVQDQPVTVDIRRRLAGATPSFADGIIVCPTGAGAVVGVDWSTRALRWGYTYKQNRTVINRGMFGPVFIRNRNQATSSANQWQDATVTIADGCAILTPVESGMLHCIDLHTGKSKWKKDIERKDGMYVACVHEEAVVVVGKEEIRAINLADGELAWKAGLKLSGQPAGRGYYYENYYVLPVTSKKLLQINLDSGKQENELDTELQLGNLIVHGDDVISQTSEGLIALSLDKPQRRKIAERLRNNPLDGEAWAMQAEILRQDGKVAEALTAADKAFEINATEENRDVLIDTLMFAVRDKDLVTSSVKRLEDLLPRNDSRRRLLWSLRAEAYREAGQVVDAFEAYLKLTQFAAGEDEESEMRRIVPAEGSRRIRKGRLAASQIASMFDGATQLQREDMQTSMKSAMVTMLKEKDAAAMQQFIEIFGRHPATAELRLAAAEVVAASGQYAQAALLLSPLMESKEPTLGGAALAQMAQMQMKSQRMLEAAATVSMLQSRFPADARCYQGLTVAQVVATLGEKLEGSQKQQWEQMLADKTSWPAGQAVVEESPRSNTELSGYSRFTYAELRESHGANPPGMKLMFDRASSRSCSLLAFDKFGRPFANLPLTLKTPNTRPNVYSTRGLARNGLYVVNVGTDVYLLDGVSRGSSASMLWSVSNASFDTSNPQNRMLGFSTRTSGYSNPLGDLKYTLTDGQGYTIGAIGPFNDDGIAMLKGTELRYVDPLDGSLIWAYTGVQPGADVFGDSDVVVLESTRDKKYYVHRAADGLRMAEYPLDPSFRRWTSDGRCAVFVKQQGSELLIKSMDMGTGQEVWSRTVPQGSRGRLVGTSKIAVVQPDGDFMVYEITTPKIHVQAKLDLNTEGRNEPLSTLHVIHGDGAYYVMASRSYRSVVRTDRMTFQAAPSTSSVISPLVNGLLFAVNDETGEMKWPAPAMISQYGWPQDQPSAGPGLLFMRQGTIRENNRSRSYRAVLMIDRHDGSVLFQNDNFADTISTYRQTSNPATGAITLQFPSRTVKIQRLPAEAAPRPPEPPAQIRVPADKAGEVQAATIRSQQEQIREMIRKQQLKMKNDIEQKIRQIQQLPQAPAPAPR